MKPTHEQADITDAARQLQPGDALKIIAFAGAGKTTTLLGIANARKNDRGIYLAFNKSIADEAKRKMALTRCTAATMHSIAYGTVSDLIGSPINVNARAVSESGVMNKFHIPTVKGFRSYSVAAAASRCMAAFANSADLEFNLDHAKAALMDSVGDPERIKDRARREKAEEVMSKLADCVMNIANATWDHVLDQGKMSHDMYLKALHLDDGLRGDAFRRFKYLMLDEAQDTNPVQLAIIEKLDIPVIAVGDPYQQIYSWRGAENALAKMPGDTKYLTQSFRFGENIAEMARHILSIRPDGGPEQRLIGAGGNMKGYEGASAAIICRTNMGVIDEALAHIKRGVVIHVDNMDTLLQDVLSAQALYEGNPAAVKSSTVKQFDNWEQMTIEGEEGDSAIGRLVSLVEDGMIEDIQKMARNHKKDARQAQVVVCTAHRSKGLEFPGVMLGGDWNDVLAMQKRYEGAKKRSDKDVTSAIEAYNALYVAGTRAIRNVKGMERILFPKIEDPEEMPEPA